MNRGIPENDAAPAATGAGVIDPNIPSNLMQQLLAPPALQSDLVATVAWATPNHARKRKGARHDDASKRP